MSARARPSRGVLWLAMAAPPAAWFVHQLGVGYAMRLSCTLGGPPFGTLAGLAALLACATAAGVAWPALRSAQEETQGLLGRLALGGAGAFALAIALQTAATLIEAPCFR